MVTYIQINQQTNMKKHTQAGEHFLNFCLYCDIFWKSEHINVQNVLFPKMPSICYNIYQFHPWINNQTSALDEQIAQLDDYKIENNSKSKLFNSILTEYWDGLKTCLDAMNPRLIHWEQTCQPYVCKQQYL